MRAGRVSVRQPGRSENRAGGAPGVPRPVWVWVCVCVVERVEPMHLFPWMDTVCQRWVPVFGVPTSRQPTEYITSTNNHTMQMCSGLQPPNQMDDWAHNLLESVSGQAARGHLTRRLD